MTALSIPAGVSLVTLSDRRDGIPVWTRSFGWPVTGDRHIAFDRDRFRDGAAVLLDDAVRHAARPVVLIAEGAACFAAAWWARLTPQHEVARVAGALMFAPIVDDRADMALRRETYHSPDAPLPFPSLLLDARGQRDELAALALEWGGDVSAQPLLTRTARPTGAWSRAGRLIASVTARVVVRDIRLVRDQLR